MLDENSFDLICIATPTDLHAPISIHTYMYILEYLQPTHGSMNSLFSDFFHEFWRGMLGDVRDYFGEMLADLYIRNEGKIQQIYTRKKTN